MQGKRYIIIGDGAAGVTAGQKLRELDPLSVITLISDDPNPAYYRAALTNYLLGELTENQIWAVPPTFFYDYRVERVFGRVVKVDTASSQVWLEHGGPALGYDKLLIGSGARARPAPFQGGQLPGVTTFRTLQDARWIMDLIFQYGVKRAVVVGGGPLAIEWAVAMRERGVEVLMMVRGGRVMERELDAEGSDLVVTRMRQVGIDVRVRDEIVAAHPGPDGRVGAIQTKAGQTLECQLVGVAIGVVPNTEFLEGSQVKLGRRRGVAVGETMQSSVPNVFAAGDVAELGGDLLQLWEPARREAVVAAANMVGGKERYRPGTPYFATRLTDLDFASVGEVQGAPDIAETVDRRAELGRIAYRKVLVQNGRLLGALMLGQREEHVRARGRLYKRLIDMELDISPIAEVLLDPGFDLKGWIRARALLRKPTSGGLPPSALAGAPGSAAASQPEQPRESLPGSQASAPAAAPAALRGTQFVNLAGAVAAIQGINMQSGGSAKAEPKQAASPKMLTIGLPMATAMNLTFLGAAAGPKAALEGAGSRWPLEAAVVSIGSDPKSDVALSDPHVSHVHAQITRHGDDMFLRDVGSRSGSFVNGQRLTLPHRLQNGDKLQFGQVQLTYVAG